MSNLGNKAIMAKNIKVHMAKNGKTRKDMCEALGVKYTTFTDWVNGKTYPRIDKIELMANYFNISKADLVEEADINAPFPKVSQRESTLISKYRELDSPGQKTVDTVCDLEHERVKSAINAYKPTPVTLEEDAFTYIPIATMSVSAGFGNYLGDDSMEEVRVKVSAEVDKADYALTVSGDSMEPLYSDGDVVLVQSTSFIDIGDIGIFALNDEGYMKKAGINGLISLNKKYPDLVVGERDSFFVLGKVIGMAELG